jgi:hypothetical protein
MKRRRFLELTSLGALAASLPFVRRSGAAGSVPAAAAEPALLGVFGDRGTIRRIGALYRRTHPFEDDANVLYAAIVGDQAAGSGPQQIRATLDRRIRDEFDRGRTVQVDGWILARTEARQCALYDILSAYRPDIRTRAGSPAFDAKPPAS